MSINHEFGGRLCEERQPLVPHPPQMTGGLRQVHSSTHHVIYTVIIWTLVYNVRDKAHADTDATAAFHPDKKKKKKPFYVSN